MEIRSAQNTRYKQWKHLLTKKGRRTHGAFLVEGPHLVQEALKSDWSVPYILTCPQEYQSMGNLHFRDSRQCVVVNLEQKLFRDLTETVQSQGVIAVVEQRAHPSLQDTMSTSHCILMVDRIQDPGNLGTMIRTADAAGFDAVCMSIGTADPYSSKVLRASQGSIFHLPIYEVDMAEAISGWHAVKGVIYGADAHQGKNLFTDMPRSLPETNRFAVVIGNEANGLSPDVQSSVDEFVHIPIWGQAESLNASVASGIIMYMLQSKRR